MTVLVVMTVLLLACSKSGVGSGSDVVKGPDSGNCKDTDNSNDPKVGGQVNGVWDTCVGPDLLIERYCENCKPATQNYRCENVCDPVDHQCY